MSGPPPAVVNPTLGKDREKLPGWNDPPEMASGSSGNRNRLNKRVGFPAATGAAQPLPPPSHDGQLVMPLSTPPILQANLPPPPPAKKSDVETAGAGATLNSELTEELPDLDGLIGRLNNIMDSVGSGPDVKKRVALMQSKWDTLDSKVQLGLAQLVGCLARGDHEGAERAQRDLAVSHSSQCSAWIMAFKRLINDSKAKSKALVNQTNDEVMGQNTGYMVPGEPSTS